MFGFGFSGVAGGGAPHSKNNSNLPANIGDTSGGPTTPTIPSTPTPTASPVGQSAQAAPSPRVSTPTPRRSTGQRPMRTARTDRSGARSVVPSEPAPVAQPTEAPNYDIPGLEDAKNIAATVQSGEGTFPVRKDPYGRMNYDDRPMLETQDTALRKAWDNEPINVAERQRVEALKAKGLPADIELQSGIGHGAMIDIIPVDAKTGKMPSYKNLSAGLSPEDFYNKATALNQKQDLYHSVTNATKREPIYNDKGQVTGYHEVDDNEGTRKGLLDMGAQDIQSRRTDVDVLKTNEDIKNDRRKLSQEDQRIGIAGGHLRNEGERLKIERNKDKQENVRNSVPFQLQAEYDRAYTEYVKMVENSSENLPTQEIERRAHEYATKRRRSLAETFDQYDKTKVTPRAAGGPVEPGEDYLVGEQRPETYKAPGLPPEIVGAAGPEIRQFPKTGTIQPNIQPPSGGMPTDPKSLLTIIKTLLDMYSRTGIEGGAGPIQKALIK